ncbi:MAG: ribonuclease HII [Minisyncoccia bacterium]
MRFLIGIDEAGRGPLAGPVAVGAVLVPEGFDVSQEFPGVRDSKKLSAEKREEIYAALRHRAEAVGDVRFCVRFASHHCIDRLGITRAVRLALFACAQHLAPDPGGVHVLLDGLLEAPPRFSQETIIRGDESVPLISLASISAKVERDQLMQRMAKKFPDYGFDIHKGYATAAHREAIAERGLCAIHRVTFCKKIMAVQ